ncbi:PAS domain S-box protein [Haloferax sp. KTX1]|uniref:PAS domain S-box protein n=1 Tax=Haloferax sp. KTX1 TaxID=2600597 RepID=UPI0011DD02E5|nr:PAS domain S-box protein [Haloferax sp. KTX1]
MTTQTTAPQDSKESVLGRMTDAVFALDNDWRFTYLNVRAEDVLGADASELVGERVWDAFPEARDSTFYREYHRAVSEQEPVSFEEYYEPLETWFSVRAFPSETGLTVYFRDVTEERDRRVELERERERLGVRERFDAVFTAVPALGSKASNVGDFEARLVDRAQRVDGIHSARFDRFAAGDGTERATRCAGTLAFDSGTPAAFDEAAEQQTVTRVPIAETGVERYDALSATLVFVPVALADRFHGVLTLAVDESVHEHAAATLFERLGAAVGSVVENVARRERCRSIADAFDRADVGMYLVDETDDLAWANQTFAEYVGIDRADAVGRDHERFVDEQLDAVLEDTDRLADALLASDRGATDGSEARLARVSESYDRDERVLEHTAHSVEMGRFDGGTAHAFEDVSDRVDAEESLAEIEWVRDSLLDDFPGMIYRRRDAETWAFDHVSGRVASLTGYDADELKSNVAWETTVVHPNDRQEVRESSRAQLADGESFELTYRLVHRDGGIRWVWEYGRRLETADGERIAGFVSDITERREVKDQLQWIEDRFHSLVEHVSEYAIFSIDRDGCIENWNDGARCITGYDADEAVGMRLSAFAPDDGDERYRPDSGMAEAMLDGESSEEGWMRSKDGSEFWARVALRSLTDADGDVYGFVAVVRDMTEQRRRRRELEHQRDELVTLNRINGVIRDIDRELVRANTRQEICTAICERLTSDDRYELAWIGESDPARNAVTPIEWAGEHGSYVEDLDVTLDGELGDGPVGRSVRNQSVAVTQRIDSDPQFEPWREAALDRGFYSSASVPIEYDGIPYGVLCLYSGESEAFDERERTVLAELAEMIGYAFNAVDRKQALVEDSMTELEVTLSDTLPRLTELTEGTDERIFVTSTAETASGTFLQYVRTESVDPHEVGAVLDDVDRVRSYDVLWNRETSGSLSVSLDEAPLTQVVSAYGGRVESLVAEDGEATATIRFPKRANVRAVTERLGDAFPDLEVVAKRTVSPEDESQRLSSMVDEELTDRQTEVLRTAFHAGYYEWPRDTDGTNLSEQLDLSPATVSQHLRAAHRKVVGTVVERGGQ